MSRYCKHCGEQLDGTGWCVGCEVYPEADHESSGNIPPKAKKRVLEPELSDEEIAKELDLQDPYGWEG